MTEDLDQDLQDLVARRDPGAFEALYAAYYGRLRATTIHFLGFGDGEGEDVVQETFAVALQKLPKARIQTNLYGWLNRVCTLLCYERLRQRKRMLATDDEAMLEVFARRRDPSAGGLEDKDRWADRRRLLDMALAKLDEPCRRILELRDLRGESYADISVTLGIPIGTVMSRLLRCREALKKRMDVLLLKGTP